MKVLDPLTTYVSPWRMAEVGHGGQVASDARLRHGDGRDELARGNAGQPTPSLLVGAIGQEVGQHDVVVQGNAQAHTVAAGQMDLLVDHDVIAKIVHSTAAQLLGHRHAQEAQLAGLGEQGPVDDAVGFPLLEVGHDLVGHESPSRHPELLVIVGVERTGHAVPRHARVELALTIVVSSSISLRNGRPKRRWPHNDRFQFLPPGVVE